TPPAPAADYEVRPIPPEHLEKIFSELGPLPTLNSLKSIPRATNVDPRRLRNRLMAECGLQSGLRRAEIAELSVAHFAQVKVDPSSPYVSHPVRIFGKGA